MKSQAQILIDSQWIQTGGKLSDLMPNDEWVYGKSLQALHIHTLRDYLGNEFAVLKNNNMLPFAFNLERVIDDFIFLCFFVGNDFLPHLPSLDIRDGALDFLIEVYKELLPSLGDYITQPNGGLNLRQVDVILGKVGAIEDQVFTKRKQVEEQMEQRRNQGNNRNQHKQRQTAADQQKAQIASLQAIGAGSKGKDPPKPSPNTPLLPSEGAGAGDASNSNHTAASRIREGLMAAKPSNKRLKTDSGDAVPPDGGNTSVSAGVGEGNGNGIAEPKKEKIKPPRTKEMSADDMKSFQNDLKNRLKDRENEMFDKYRAEVVDNVKLHEQGHKER